MPELEHLGPEDGSSPLNNGYHSPKRNSPVMSAAAMQLSSEEQSKSESATTNCLPVDEKSPNNNGPSDDCHDCYSCLPDGRPPLPVKRAESKAEKNGAASFTNRPSVNGDEEMKTEEEKIQEYLRRSDTAVIYAEPVDNEKSSHEPANKITGESFYVYIISQKFILSTPTQI